MRRFFLLLALCAPLYIGVILALDQLTDMSELKNHYPQVIYRGHGKATKLKIEAKQPLHWTGLGKISPIAVEAIMISEDDAFYLHNGYDYEQIKESFEKDLREHRFSRGGSTITQQVVKNVYLSGEKSLFRKMKELVLALRMERQLGKHRILEIYLNIAEFGEGIYGIAPASRFYFQKEPSELNAKEGAFLAMLLPSPKRYSQSFRKHELTPYARSIVDSLLAKLWATNHLGDLEYAEELSRPLPFERPLESKRTEPDASRPAEPNSAAASELIHNDFPTKPD